MKKSGFILTLLILAFISSAQSDCVFKPPELSVHFGTGNMPASNNSVLSSYRQVYHTCPSDGFFSFAPFTSSCFNDDWHTLTEDHTPGDNNGNMLLVNAGEEGSVFLKMPITGLKGNTLYQLGVWLVNLCKPTKKCGFALLPNLNIRLETPEGKLVANIATGELPRIPEPRWTHYIANFTTPASASNLMLVMTDKMPSGCGNDFALDDITFRECVKKETIKPVVIPKTTSTAKQTTIQKPVQKKETITPKKKDPPQQVIRPKTDTASKVISVVKQNLQILPPAPLILKTRENELARRFETQAGEIKIDIYDNGEIDGDTVSIYHNNVLFRSHMRLSQKPISFTINVDPSQSHHEIIMVAENLGSIPPNTSIMLITIGTRRFQVFISSSEQKNAKVVFDLIKNE